MKLFAIQFARPSTCCFAAFGGLTGSLLMAAPAQAASGPAPVPVSSAAGAEAALKAAKSGTIVQLAAGDYLAGDWHVPPGVTLRGTGFQSTAINATGHDGGVILGEGSTLQDLTVKNAGGSGIVANHAANVRLERVRSLGNLNGVTLDHADHARLVNLLVARNRTGIALAHCANSVVVNCTLANNAGLALSLTGSQKVAVFNNLMVGSAVAAYLTPDNQDVSLDANLYAANFVGRLAGDPPRKSLFSWRDLTGQDVHSLAQPLEFGDAAHDDYTPVTPQSWRPNYTGASGWGLKALPGFEGPQYLAPAQDAIGGARHADLDLGALENRLPAIRPADGQFTVKASAGIKSAGIFTPDGHEVAYLFQNLPLAAGKYPFWLPSRDWQGRPLAAGNYELRLVESGVHLRYVALAANGGPSVRQTETSSIDPQLVVTDTKDRILLFEWGAESHQYLRSFEPEMSANRWVLPGEGETAGAAVDGDNHLYVLRDADKDGSVNLLKLDAETGHGIAIQNGSYQKPVKGVFSSKVHGLAALGDSIYAADAEKNKIFVANSTALLFDHSLDVPAPRGLAGDAEHNLLWVLSGGKLLALDPKTGTVKFAASPVEQPTAVAYNNHRLAISSAASHKIHVFDATDPGNLKPVVAMGRDWTGNAPYGPIVLDRIAGSGPVALNSHGDVVTIDPHIRLFDATGSLKTWRMAVWGQQVPSGALPQGSGQELFTFTGLHSVVLDAKSHNWKPGSVYKVPAEELADQWPVAYVTVGGVKFGIFGLRDKVTGIYSYSFVRFDDGIGRRVMVLGNSAQGCTVLTDSNGDGAVDKADTAQPLLANGKAVKSVTVRDDGRLFADYCLVPLQGLSPAGVPQWDWSHFNPRPLLTDTDFISPYDLKTKEAVAVYSGQAGPAWDEAPDGRTFVKLNLRSGGGPGFGGGGTDLAAFDPQGHFLWLHPVQYPGTQLSGMRGFNWLPGILLATHVEEMETEALDEDGLSLGTFGPNSASNWRGYWLDQDFSQVAFQGNDGKPYLVQGDYTKHGIHWFAIDGLEAVLRSKVALNVDAARATLLAALPAPALVRAANSPTPQVKIAKLAAPLPIDGDIAKWRKLGIAPQIIITPEASNDITSPADASALVRMAYQGDDLYVQVIKFDDVVTMHQTSDKHYKQDSTEIALAGGFMGGYKFSVTNTVDKGEIMLREQFLVSTKFLDAAAAPRVVRVLDSAADVEERKLIESTYGVDLSGGKVIVTEFKIPVTPTWEGRPPFKMASGAGLWLGFFIDDNDTPGADIQKVLPWPATFGVFANPNKGAWATFE